MNVLSQETPKTEHYYQTGSLHRLVDPDSFKRKQWCILSKEMSSPSNNVGNSRGRGKDWKREFVLVLDNLVKVNWRSLGLGDANVRNIPYCF